MRIDLGILRTRVARRILLFFLLCAVLPVSVLFFLSYVSVRNQLLGDTQNRLIESSKTAGNALVERFQFLESRARLTLVHSGLLDPGTGSETVRIDEDFQGFEAAALLQEEEGFLPLFGDMVRPGELSEAERAHLRDGHSILRVRRTPGGDPEILMGMELLEPGYRRGLLWVRLDLGFLWSTAAAYAGLSENAGFCILEEDHTPLHCTLPDPEAFRSAIPGGSAGQGPDQRYRSFEWEDQEGTTYLAGARDIFLRAQFVLPGFQVVVSESRDNALANMGTFQSTFWRVILVGLAAVALLSNIQIRRSLDPLVELRKGTQRVAQGEFRERVSVTSKDEFEDLADSFNTMAHNLESQFQALATIGEIDRAILSELDANGILQTALLRMKDILPCDMVGVCTLDWLGAREGRIRVYDVPAESLGSEMRVLLSTDDLTRIQGGGDYQIIDGDDLASQYFGVAPGTRGVAKAVVAPLQLPEGLAGFLAAGRLEAVDFSETDLSRIQQIGKQLSIALANAWLLEELDRMTWGALTALARTIDAKSPWTSGHSENVATLSVAIGRRMGLPEATLTALQRGGLVHDIGKIAVPGAILDKNGKLTPEEREMIMIHPAEGVQILEPVPAMEAILPMVLHHHEAWDGSGYPQGLAGEAIPLEARIMAVADQFDAVSSDRPYRKGFGEQKTMEYLRDQAGKNLDPAIVEVFIGLLEAGDLPVQTPFSPEIEP